MELLLLITVVSLYLAVLVFLIWLIAKGIDLIANLVVERLKEGK